MNWQACKLGCRVPCDLPSGLFQCVSQSVTFLVHRFTCFIGLRFPKIDRLVANPATDFGLIRMFHKARLLGKRTAPLIVSAARLRTYRRTKIYHQPEIIGRMAAELCGLGPESIDEAQNGDG